MSPAEEYIFLLDMLLIQPHIFKHQGDRWVVSCQSDELITHSQPLDGRYYIQEESPKTGAYWMESGVNFTRVKITNSKELKSHKNMIQVHSMHYYIPRISVVRLNRVNGTHLNYSNHHNNNNHSQYNSSMVCLPQSDQLELIGAYIIPGTQFYTVTAYQNPDVIRIKINNNPFAKGFRNRQDQDDLSDMAMLSAMNIKSKYMMMMMTTTTTAKEGTFNSLNTIASSSSPLSTPVLPTSSSSGNLTFTQKQTTPQLFESGF
ncbi:unnamed protein product [Trichobilharzia regenti]|nr:unnamed protein product [Trichobilharzia regenti]